MTQLFNGGGLLGGVSGALEQGIPEQTRSEPGESYRKPMTVEAFDSFGASLISAGETVELASWEVPAGIQRRWGFGRADTDANQGYLYGVFENADNEQIHGEVTFKWRNSTGRSTQTVDEADSRDMDTSNRYDREQQIPFPEATDKKKATKDQELVVEFTPTTEAANITNNYAIDAGASSVRFPTTEYDVSE